MKTAVAYLEPHMEKTDDEGKGTIVLATVKGDVHDIGKNLVDIILTNNGYTVVNLGIKQPVAEIIEQAEKARRRRDRHVRAAGQVHRRDEGEPRGDQPARRRAEVPGAPRRRRAHPRVRRAGPRRDLRRRRCATPATRSRACASWTPSWASSAACRVPSCRRCAVAASRSATVRPDETPVEDLPARSDVATDNPVPTPPFWGSRIVRGRRAGRLRQLPRRARDLPGPVGPQARPRRRRRVVRGARRDRGPPAAAHVARPHAHRRAARGGRRLRLLPLLRRGRRPRDPAPRGRARGPGACALHLPAAAPRPAPVPVGLLPLEGVGGDRRHRVPRRHHGQPRRRGDRRSSSPRTPTATTSSCTASRCS